MRIVCKSITPRFLRVAAGGFSMIEVLIASLVGAVIFLALFVGMSQGFNIVQHQRASLRATQILVGKIEGIRLCAWGDTTNQLFSTNIVPGSFTDYFYPVGVSGYNGSNIVYNGTVFIQGTNITFYNNGGTTNGVSRPSYRTNMAQVIVTVKWNEVSHNRTNTYLRSMSTYVAKYGIQNYIIGN